MLLICTSPTLFPSSSSIGICTIPVPSCTLYSPLAIDAPSLPSTPSLPSWPSLPSSPFSPCSPLSAPDSIASLIPSTLVSRLSIASAFCLSLSTKSFFTLFMSPIVILSADSSQASSPFSCTGLSKEPPGISKPSS